ncbi:MAG: hypothetical protein DRH11_16930 [Deltaproteobacteria bacterium]|nr:MAG: hypothetical protein DRH11_16930 [Deltaproteobacteria bacterium]
MTTETEDSKYHMIGKRGEASVTTEPDPGEDVEPERKKMMVMIPMDRMGYGNDDLGLKLMVSS